MLSVCERGQAHSAGSGAMLLFGMGMGADARSAGPPERHALAAAMTSLAPGPRAAVVVVYLVVVLYL